MQKNMGTSRGSYQRQVVFVALLLWSATGCASLREAGRKIWGSSIAHLEAAREEARVVTVSGPGDAVYGQVMKVLQAAGAQIHLQPKNRAYLVAMGFKGHVDTTQAGIFFTSLSDQKTRVEVASMSPRLADDVAAMISQDPGITVLSEKGEGV